MTLNNRNMRQRVGYNHVINRLVMGLSPWLIGLFHRAVGLFICIYVYDWKRNAFFFIFCACYRVFVLVCALAHPLFCVSPLAGGCQPSAPEQKSSSHTNGSGGKKVEVIDLTLDSSSEDEEEEEPPVKRNCPSLSPVSPQMNKGWV